MERLKRHLSPCVLSLGLLTLTAASIWQVDAAVEHTTQTVQTTTQLRKPSRHEGLGPHLHRVLRDGNATRLILPNEDTVIIDGTRGNIIEGFGKEAWKLKRSKFPKKVALPSNDLFGTKKFLALFVVCSQPVESEKVRRDTIRRSWGRWAPELDIKIIFFLGTKPGLTSEVASSLLDEINKHHDIVIDSMEDDYYRTSVKALRMFKWFLRRFPDASTRPTFVAKCDPDSFINLRVVARYLRNAPNQDSFVGGTFYGWRWVEREPWAKHFIPYHYYSEPQFPRFFLGCLMMFSSTLVRALLEASLPETLIPDDDVFITGIIANEKLGLNLTGIPGYHTIEWKINVSNPFMEAVLYHLPSAAPEVFVKLYEDYNKAQPVVE